MMKSVALGALLLLATPFVGTAQRADEDSFQACVQGFVIDSCDQGASALPLGLYRCEHLLDGSSATPQSVRVLLPDVYAPWLLPALDRFAALYGVDVVHDVLTLGEVAQLAQQAVLESGNRSLAQGAAPSPPQPPGPVVEALGASQGPPSVPSYDVWLHPIDQTLHLADAGLLTDLGHLVELADRNLAWQGVSQQLRLLLGTYLGATVAVPLDGSTLLTLYRHDVLGALGLPVPATWHELLDFVKAYAQARQLRVRLAKEQQQQQQEDGDLPPYALCLPPRTGCSQLSLLAAVWSSLAQTRGPQQGVHFDTGGGAGSLAPLLDTPAGREAFRLVERLVAAAAPAEPGEGCSRGSLGFARGRCALVVAGFAAQMRMFLEPSSNATVAQSSVRAARLPGSELVWRGDAGGNNSSNSNISTILVACTPATCPYATPVAAAAAAPSGSGLLGATSSSSPPPPVGRDQGEQQQRQRLVNFAPLLPQTLLVGSVSSRSRPVMQLMSYELLAYIGSPDRYGSDSAVGVAGWVSAGAASPNGSSHQPQQPAPAAPPPVSPLSCASPVRQPYLSDQFSDLWIQAGYDADLVRSALPVMAEASQHPNLALGLRMAGAGYYNGLLESILEGIESGRVTEVDPADAGAAPPPPSPPLPLRVRQREAAEGPVAAGAASSNATTLAAAAPAAPDPACVLQQAQSQQWPQTLAEALAEAQSLLALCYRPEAYRARYLASLAIPTPVSGPNGGNNSTDAAAATCSLCVPSKVVAAAVVASLVGFALLVAAAVAVVLVLPGGYRRRLSRHLSRHLLSRSRLSYRRKPSDMSVSTHPQVTAPQASSDTAILVTDIQSSTLLWETVPTEDMNAAVQLHHSCVRRLLVQHEGYESATEGDSFILAFRSVKQAVALAIELQAQLLLLPWPEELLKEEVCMPIYTDLPEGFPFTHHSDDGHGLKPPAAAAFAAASPLSALAAAAATTTGARSPRCTTARLCTSGSLGVGPPSCARGTLDSHGAISRNSARSTSRAPTPRAGSATAQHAALWGRDSGPRHADRQHPRPQEVQLALAPQRQASLFSSGFSLLRLRTRAECREVEAGGGGVGEEDTACGGRAAAAAVAKPGPSGFAIAASSAAAAACDDASAVKLSGGDHGGGNVPCNRDGGGDGRRRFVLAAPAAALVAAAVARALTALSWTRVATSTASGCPSLGASNTERHSGLARWGQPLRSSRVMPPPVLSTNPSFMSLGSGGELSTRASAALHLTSGRPKPMLAPTSDCDGDDGGGGGSEGDGDGREGLRDRPSTMLSNANMYSRDVGPTGLGSCGNGAAASPFSSHVVAPPLRRGVSARLAAVTAVTAPQAPPRSFSSGDVTPTATADAVTPGCGRLIPAGPVGVLARPPALSAETLGVAVGVLNEEAKAEGAEAAAAAEEDGTMEEGNEAGKETPGPPPPPSPLVAPPLGKTLRQLLRELHKPAFAMHEAPERARRVLMFRGLRVRVGIHAGVSSGAEVVYNAAAARNVFSGPCVATCKVVADMAHGGQVFLSEAAREALEAATHHHNGGRPAGTLMLHLGTYAPEGSSGQHAALASAAVSIATAAGACPSGLRASSRLCASSVPPASGPPSALYPGQHATPAPPSATFSLRASDGGPSLEIWGLQSAKSHGSAAAVTAAGDRLSPPPAPAQLPATTAAAAQQQQQQCAYWITSPSLSQRLALLPPPRAPPKGYRTLNDVYDAPVGRASYVVVQVPAAAALLAWDEQVAKEALALFVSEAAEQLRVVRGGYLSSPHPGELCAAFTSAASAARWAEGLRQRLLDAPWSQELLAHEMCEPVEVSDSDTGSSSSSSSPSGCSSPRTATPSAGAPSLGANDSGGGDGGGGGSGSAARAFSGPPSSLRVRLCAASSALLPSHHLPFLAPSSPPAAPHSPHHQHQHHHGHHHHHQHHLHHAHTHDVLRQAFTHHHHHHNHNHNHGHLQNHLVIGPPSHQASARSDASSRTAASGLAAWISSRLSHHSTGPASGSGCGSGIASPFRRQPTASTTTPSPTLALPPPLACASPAPTPFSALAASAAVAAAAAAAATVGSVGGGECCSPAFSHGPSRLGLMSRGVGGSDTFAQRSPGSAARQAHSSSLVHCKLPTDGGYFKGSPSSRQRRSSAAAAGPMQQPPAGWGSPHQATKREASTSVQAPRAVQSPMPYVRGTSAEDGDEDEEVDEVMALMRAQPTCDRQAAAPRLSLGPARTACQWRSPLRSPAPASDAVDSDPKPQGQPKGDPGEGDVTVLAGGTARQPTPTPDGTLLSWPPASTYVSSENDNGGNGHESGNGSGGNGSDGGRAAARSWCRHRHGGMSSTAGAAADLAVLQGPSHGAEESPAARSSSRAATPKSPAELPGRDDVPPGMPRASSGDPTQLRQIRTPLTDIGAQLSLLHHPSLGDMHVRQPDSSRQPSGYLVSREHPQRSSLQPVSSPALVLPQRQGGAAPSLAAGFTKGDGHASHFLRRSISSDAARVGGAAAAAIGGGGAGGGGRTAADCVRADARPSNPDGLNASVSAAKQALDEILPQRPPPRGVPIERLGYGGEGDRGDGGDDASVAAGATATELAAQRGRRLLLRGLRMRAGIATGPVSWSVADHTHDVAYSGKPVRTALRLAASAAASGMVLCCAVTCAEAVAAQAAQAAAAAEPPQELGFSLGLRRRQQQQQQQQGACSALSRMSGASAAPKLAAAAALLDGPSGALLFGAGSVSPPGASGKRAAVATEAAEEGQAGGELVMAFAPMEQGGRRRKSAAFVCGLYHHADLGPNARHATLSGWATGASAARAPDAGSQLSSERTTDKSPRLPSLGGQALTAGDPRATTAAVAGAAASSLALTHGPPASGPLLRATGVSAPIAERPGPADADYGGSSMSRGPMSPPTYWNTASLLASRNRDGVGAGGRDYMINGGRRSRGSRPSMEAPVSGGGGSSGRGRISAGGGWFSRGSLAQPANSSCATSPAATIAVAAAALSVGLAGAASPVRIVETGAQGVFALRLPLSPQPPCPTLRRSSRLSGCTTMAVGSGALGSINIASGGSGGSGGSGPSRGSISTEPARGHRLTPSFVPVWYQARPAAVGPFPANEQGQSQLLQPLEHCLQQPANALGSGIGHASGTAGGSPGTLCVASTPGGAGGAVGMTVVNKPRLCPLPSPGGLMPPARMLEGLRVPVSPPRSASSPTGSTRQPVCSTAVASELYTGAKGIGTGGGEARRARCLPGGAPERQRSSEERCGATAGDGGDGSVETAPLPVLRAQPGTGRPRDADEGAGEAASCPAPTPSGGRWVMPGLPAELVVIGAASCDVDAREGTGSTEVTGYADGDIDGASCGGSGGSRAGGAVPRGGEPEAVPLDGGRLGGAAAGGEVRGQFGRQSSPTDDSVASDNAWDPEVTAGASATAADKA